MLWVDLVPYAQIAQALWKEDVQAQMIAASFPYVSEKSDRNRIWRQFSTGESRLEEARERLKRLEEAKQRVV